MIYYKLGLEEINNNVINCKNELVTLNTKIDATNAYLESIDSNVKDIRNAIISTNEKIDKTNEKLDNVNNNITNSDVTANGSSLPTDSTDDPTSSGFNNIFTQLYNTFTSGAAKDVVVNVPFTDKSFTINVASVYGNADLGYVSFLITNFWYFTVCYFIVNDIAHKINRIKSGDIEHVQNDNIKEDML